MGRWKSEAAMLYDRCEDVAEEGSQVLSQNYFILKLVSKQGGGKYLVFVYVKVCLYVCIFVYFKN